MIILKSRTFSFHLVLSRYSCGSVIADTELIFDSASEVNEQVVNTIMEQSADEFLSYNLSLIDPGTVESTSFILFTAKVLSNQANTVAKEEKNQRTIIFLFRSV